MALNNSTLKSNFNMKIPRGYFEDSESSIVFPAAPKRRFGYDSEQFKTKKLNISLPSKAFTIENKVNTLSTNIKKEKDQQKGLRILTGNIEQILKLSKTLKASENILFEVFGRVVNIQNGRYNCEKIILLRDPNGIGPVVQCCFYEIDIKMEEFRCNDLVRCIGKFVNQSRFFLVKIRKTDHLFIASVPRLNAICNFISNRDKLTKSH